jgi:hypothetical protein
MLPVLASERMPVDDRLLVNLLEYPGGDAVILAIARFFLVCGFPPAVLEVMVELVLIGAVQSHELAFAIVQLIAVGNPELSLQIAVMISRRLSKADEYSFALKLFYWESLPLGRDFVKKYPFLSFYTDPQATLAWLDETDITLWPLRVNDSFDRAIVELLSKRRHKCVLSNLDRLTRLDWRFVLGNLKLFESKMVTDYMGTPCGMNHTKRIARCAQNPSFSAPKLGGRIFIGSVAPFLRRGVVPRSKYLVNSFLSHSLLRLTPGIRAKIKSRFPRLQPRLVEYTRRLSLATENDCDPGVEAFLSSFSMQAKSLRNLCATASDTQPGRLELTRRAILQRLNEIQKPKQWFFVLRFFRLALVCELNAGKRELICQSIIESLSQIAPSLSADAPLREVFELARCVYERDALRKFVEQFPAFSLRIPQEDIDFPEVPSRALEICRFHSLYSKSVIHHFVDGRSAQILSDLILASGVFQLLCEHVFLTKSIEYAVAIAQGESPLFYVGAKLLKVLIRRHPAVVEAIHPAIAKFPECASSVDRVLSVVQAFREMIATAHGDGGRTFAVLSELFRARPSLKFAKALAVELIHSAPFLDSNSLLFANLASIDHGFIFVLIVVREVFRALDSEKARAAFFAKMNEMSSSIMKSRLRALVKLTEGEIDEAFMCALAETDDNHLLERHVKTLTDADALLIKK